MTKEEKLSYQAGQRRFKHMLQQYINRTGHVFKAELEGYIKIHSGFGPNFSAGYNDALKKWQLTQLLLKENK